MQRQTNTIYANWGARALRGEICDWRILELDKTFSGIGFDIPIYKTGNEMFNHLKWKCFAPICWFEVELRLSCGVVLDIILCCGLRNVLTLSWKSARSLVTTAFRRYACIIWFQHTRISNLYESPVLCRGWFTWNILSGLSACMRRTGFLAELCRAKWNYTTQGWLKRFRSTQRRAIILSCIILWQSRWIIFFQACLRTGCLMQVCYLCLYILRLIISRRFWGVFIAGRMFDSTTSVYIHTIAIIRPINQNISG